jgi:hypothetical protein
MPREEVPPHAAPQLIQRHRVKVLQRQFVKKRKKKPLITTGTKGDRILHVINP